MAGAHASSGPLSEAIQSRVGGKEHPKKVMHCQ